jgi:hypothetical protein
MTEIREAATLEEANRLLARGFVLVKVMERMVYVVGLPKEVRQQNVSENGRNERPASAEPTESVTLQSLPWKKFRSGSGEWVSLLGPNGSLLPELEPSKQFIERLRNGKEVVIDGWRYRISNKKFLNRFPSR